MTAQEPHSGRHPDRADQRDVRDYDDPFADVFDPQIELDPTYLGGADE